MALTGPLERTLAMVLTHMDAEEENDLGWQDYYESCGYCDEHTVPSLDGPVCSECNVLIPVYEERRV